LDSNFYYYGSAGAAEDPSIQTRSPIFITFYNFKSIALTIPGIFPNHIAEDTWEEIIILKDFRARKHVSFTLQRFQINRLLGSGIMVL
jgi:hypothetical protein